MEKKVRDVRLIAPLAKKRAQQRITFPQKRDPETKRIHEGVIIHIGKTIEGKIRLTLRVEEQQLNGLMEKRAFELLKLEVGAPVVLRVRKWVDQL